MPDNDDDDLSIDTSETYVLSGSDDPMERIFTRFLASFEPFGFVGGDEDLLYHPLPYKPEPGDTLVLSEPWRIKLELHADDQRRFLGLDLYNDVILGRGTSDIGKIIVDLNPYGAKTMGVSREHVLLRPTKTRLYAIDQGSTNGTSVNTVPSGLGVATEVHDDDLLSLGNLTIMVHIVLRPGAS